MSPVRCRELMHHLQELEITRMQKLRSFIMPKVNVGDLIEVKYELSRSQQTFAVFQGYCVEVRNRRLNSSFILKTTYDGIGVEQLIPRYSPRLLDVRVVKPLDPPAPRPDRRPITKNYKYKWHNYVRSRFSEGSEVRWRRTTGLQPRTFPLWPTASLAKAGFLESPPRGLPLYLHRLSSRRTLWSPMIRGSDRPLGLRFRTQSPIAISSVPRWDLLARTGRQLRSARPGAPAP